MDDKSKSGNKSRRDFLSLFMANKKTDKPGMVKMLTADGKLVHIDKAVLEAASKKQRSTNKEIFDWMQNPSKEDNK